MTAQKVTIERITVTSPKPFDAVISALEAAVGPANMAEYVKRTEGARTLQEMETAVEKAIGPSGFMMFLKLDLGAVLRKETGLDSPKIVRFLIGNPLIMREMARHVPDAGSYAPVTILVDQRPPAPCICPTTGWPAFSPPTKTQSSSCRPRPRPENRSVPDTGCRRLRPAPRSRFRLPFCPEGI